MIFSQRTPVSFTRITQRWMLTFISSMTAEQRVAHYLERMPLAVINH